MPPGKIVILVIFTFAFLALGNENDRRRIKVESSSRNTLGKKNVSFLETSKTKLIFYY